MVIASFDLVNLKVTFRGVDDSGLGRWTWMRWGKTKLNTTRIVSAYA